MFRLKAWIFLLLCLTVFTHEGEPPHFKYSKEANEEHSFHKSSIPRQYLRSDPPQQIWCEVLGAVGAISILPLILLFLIPDLNKHRRLLKVLLGFAAGGLLGDAFLHLIPHAIESHEHRHHNHDHHQSHHSPAAHHHVEKQVVVGFWVFSGIFAFLCVEKIVRLFKHGSSSCVHSHTVVSQPSGDQPSGVVADSAPVNAKGSGKKSKKTGGGAGDEQHAASTGKNKDKKQSVRFVIARDSQFKVSGYLNLVADFTHNFTDGLAIGASLLVSRSVGMVTATTVLFHELPHEIGDYAILIQSGCSARKAMLLQLVTAVGALLGAAISLLTAGVGVEQYVEQFQLPILTDQALVAGCVLPFTAGGFIYIALTSVLPDLLASDESQVKQQQRTGFLSRLGQSLIELVALVGGVGMMAVLTTFE